LAAQIAEKDRDPHSAVAGDLKEGAVEGHHLCGC
jgi:hypothetical protein